MGSARAVDRTGVWDEEKLTKGTMDAVTDPYTVKWHNTSNKYLIWKTDILTEEWNYKMCKNGYQHVILLDVLRKDEYKAKMLTKNSLILKDY